MAKPIVVVGMHRSGTSLVSRLLDKLGILMGRDLQEDHESKFFIGLNKWIYANAGADWARPAALSELIDFEPAREKVVQYLITRLSSTYLAIHLARDENRSRYEARSGCGSQPPYEEQ